MEDDGREAGGVVFDTSVTVLPVFSFGRSLGPPCKILQATLELLHTGSVAGCDSFFSRALILQLCSAMHFTCFYTFFFLSS